MDRYKLFAKAIKELFKKKEKPPYLELIGEPFSCSEGTNVDALVWKKFGIETMFLDGGDAIDMNFYTNRFNKVI